MAAAPPITRTRAGKAAYLAIRADVEEKLEQGYYLISIFAEHEDRLPFGYKQFAKYVQRYSAHSRPFPLGWANKQAVNP